MKVESVAIGQNRFALWGVTVKDFKMDGVAVDFETLVVAMATGMATMIEKEVTPLSDQATVRNQRLKSLGDALGDLAGIQALFGPETKGDDTVDRKPLKATIDLVGTLGDNIFNSDGKISKANCERAIQLVKSEMDKLNNDAQTDMTRLQSLVSSRDEKFTTASTIMSSISEVRTNAIRAMGV